VSSATTSERRVTDDLLVERGAASRRIELDETSWVDLIEGFVRSPTTVFETLHDGTRWEQAEVLRYERYVPERRLGAVLDPDREPLLRQTGLHLRSRYSVPFSGVGALLYRDGTDFQGLHSDREMRWLDETLIAIVVLGQRRPFVLRERQPLADVVERVPAGAQDDDMVLTPGEGDMIVMGGACQRDWLHGVPGTGTGGGRISLTWRWTSRRGRPDTNPGYYEGRQFSDRQRQPGWRARPS
jgi:alkylated DNA repair dioxygenase AlkB